MNKKTHPTRPKTEFIRLVCRQAGEKVDEKVQWAKAGIENAAQNITALTSTTRGKALGIAAGLSLAACSKEDDPMPTPDPQPTTKANTITVLQNPPTTVSGKVGDTLPFFHGKYRALKGDVAVNVHETQDPTDAIRILPHAHPDSTNVAFDKAATAKMEVKASSARQVEDDTTFLAEELTKEITGQGVEPELTAEQVQANFQKELDELPQIYVNPDDPDSWQTITMPLEESSATGVHQGWTFDTSPSGATTDSEFVTIDGKKYIQFKLGKYPVGSLKLKAWNSTGEQIEFTLNQGVQLDFRPESREQLKNYLRNYFIDLHLKDEFGEDEESLLKWKSDIQQKLFYEVATTDTDAAAALIAASDQPGGAIYQINELYERAGTTLADGTPRRVVIVDNPSDANAVAVIDDLPGGKVLGLYGTFEEGANSGKVRFNVNPGVFHLQELSHMLYGIPGEPDVPTGAMANNGPAQVFNSAEKICNLVYLWQKGAEEQQLKTGMTRQEVLDRLDSLLDQVIAQVAAGN